MYQHLHELKTSELSYIIILSELEIPKLEVDTTKAKKLLGWKPKVTLNEGLKQGYLKTG